jgi:hypothetical protein
VIALGMVLLCHPYFFGFRRGFFQHPVHRETTGT